MFNFKNVIHHFDKKSEKYDLNSKTLPWSLIRYFETNIILKLVGKLKIKKFWMLGVVRDTIQK